MPRVYRLSPLSVFSSEFTAHPDDARGPSFRAMINTFGEQGAIIDNAGAQYAIVKHGFSSGLWSLRGQAGDIAQAQKSDPFNRRFSLTVPGGTLLLYADNPFSRAFSLTGQLTPPNEQGNAVRPPKTPAPNRLLGTVVPAGVFTRSATVTFDDAIDPPVGIFCFWLAALMWRRRARQN